MEQHVRVKDVNIQRLMKCCDQLVARSQLKHEDDRYQLWLVRLCIVVVVCMQRMQFIQELARMTQELEAYAFTSLRTFIINMGSFHEGSTAKTEEYRRKIQHYSYLIDEDKLASLRPFLFIDDDDM